MLKKKQGPPIPNEKIPQKTDIEQKTPKNPNFRLTVDLSDVNSILWGQKFINLSKHEEILENLNDCFLSKFDLAEYFFCFNLDKNFKKGKFLFQK